MLDPAPLPPSRVADLRGRSDEDCVIAMSAIADARFQHGLLEEARGSGKLARGFAPPSDWSRNTPAALDDALGPLRRDGTLPDYPLGSDFTDVEQRLVRALSWLKARTATRRGLVATVLHALARHHGGDPDALERMALTSPAGIKSRIEARLLALALNSTRRDAP